MNSIKIKCLIVPFNYEFIFQCCMIRFTYSLVRFRDMYVRCMTTQGMQEYLYIACAINFIKFNYLLLDQLKSNIRSLHNGDGCGTDTLDQGSCQMTVHGLISSDPDKNGKNDIMLSFFCYLYF